MKNNTIKNILKELIVSALTASAGLPPVDDQIANDYIA